MLADIFITHYTHTYKNISRMTIGFNGHESNHEFGSVHEEGVIITKQSCDISLLAHLKNIIVGWVVYLSHTHTHLRCTVQPS